MNLVSGIKTMPPLIPVIEFLLICHVAALSQDAIIKQLQTDISDLKQKEFQNSVQIQGLTSELAKKDDTISQLQRQLNALVSEQTKATDDLRQQKTSLQKVTDRQSQNGNQIVALTGRVTVAETQTNKQKLDFQTSENDLKNLTSMVDTMSHSVTDQGNIINATKAANQRQWVEFQEFKSSMVANFAKEEDQIAFMVRFLNDNGHHDVQGMLTLQFDDILLNAGNGYNANSGIFTAPAKGIYLFQLTTTSVGKSIKLYIAGDSSKDVTYGRAVAAQNFEQSSTNAVVHLDIGDKVWVKKQEGQRVGSMGFTQFSGLLIQAD